MRQPMLVNCLILFILLFSFPVFSQKVTNQLSGSIKNHVISGDTKKISWLLARAERAVNININRHINLDSADNLYREAVLINQRLANRKMAGRIYFVGSLIYRAKGKSKEANYALQKAVSIFSVTKEDIFLGQSLEEIAKYEAFDQKISHLQQARSAYHRAGQKWREANCLTKIGEEFHYGGQIDKALIHYQMALDCYKTMHYRDLRSLYTDMCFCEVALGNWKYLLTLGTRSLKNHEYMHDTTSMTLYDTYKCLSMAANTLKDSAKALLYGRKALLLALKSKEPEAVYEATCSVAFYLLNKQETVNAYNLLISVHKKIREPIDTFSKIGFNSLALEACTRLKKIDEGQIYCTKLIRLSSFYKKQHKAAIYDNLVSFYLVSGQLIDAQNYKQLSDESYHLDSLMKTLPSGTNGNVIIQKKTVIDNGYPLILDDSRSRELRRLRDETDNRQKVLTLTNLRKLQQSNLNQAILVRNTIIGASVLLALLLILTYYNLRSKHLTNQLLEHQQSTIYEKSISLERLLTEKDLLLVEKECLVREIHHRVKDNLQTVISLLSTQSDYLLDNTPALNAIRESQQRMQSISLIHQRLSQSENLALIEMQRYIKDLISNLRDSFSFADELDFSFDLIPLELDVSQAIPIGLILNEAITNAVKYSKKNNGNARIEIILHRGKDDRLIFTVKDNGPGFPQDFNIDNCNTLGMTLMNGLSRQLRGSLSIFRQNHQTVLTVEFVESESNGLQNICKLRSDA